MKKMTNKQKLIEGEVICNKHALNGTLFVRVTSSKYNASINKTVKSKKVFCVHHEEKTLIKLNTPVKIVSCRLQSPAKSHQIYKEVL